MPEVIALPNDEGSVVRKKSLKEEVFDLLHQRILAGKYLPGDWLRQEEISTCGLFVFSMECCGSFGNDADISTILSVTCTSI